MDHTVFSWFELLLGFLGVLALFLIFFMLVVLGFLKKKKSSHETKIQITNLNQTFKENKEKILREVITQTELKKLSKQEKQEKKLLKQKEKENPETEENKKRIFVLDFVGDIAASAVSVFRDQITALLQVARESDEILVRLESPGGMVHSYGLAASQLARIREKRIPLTICIDKVAASGGYMMACLANKMLAAPFAIVGSIGVIASFPNINKILRKNDVDYFEITAGEYKRTLTPLGEVTEKGKSKFQEQINETHILFKDHIKKYRDIVDIDLVSTGEYWYGTKALELKLIDEIRTSDDYLLAATHDCKIYHIFTPKKETLREKLLGGLNSVINLMTEKKQTENKYPYLL